LIFLITHIEHKNSNQYKYINFVKFCICIEYFVMPLFLDNDENEWTIQLAKDGEIERLRIRKDNINLTYSIER